MTFPDDLRIGDAERDAAMAALREHYAQGRLTHEELDERLELVLSARTGRDLAPAFADLPDLYGSRADAGDHHAAMDGEEEYGERWDHHPWAGRSRSGERREARRRHRHGPRWAHGGWPPPPPPLRLDPAMTRQLAAWQQTAAMRRRHAGHRHGPGPFPILIMLAVLAAITGFGFLKFLLIAGLVLAVAKMLHRKHEQHHRMHQARRIGHPGAF
ncbi:DUF1707 domain-containing protein [Streptosporangium sp. NPDC051022]|uniref:DUF1707 SHOCT-like domain-containing protein n=1 Tax=Streptosporangium sp. NPDC051022 TaxID=3155752 RepID=UPI0034163AB2